MKKSVTLAMHRFRCPIPAKRFSSPKMHLCDITPRQFEVYLLLVTTAIEGPELAKRLGISHPTLKVHTSRIFDLLGVDSRLELMTQYHYREQHGEDRECNARHTLEIPQGRASRSGGEVVCVGGVRG